MVWIYSLISVFLVSLVSLIGIVSLFLKKEKLQKITIFLVSFAVGALFGNTLIHLLPEAFENSTNKLFVSLSVILGIIIFFILEKFLLWRHCHRQHCDLHLRPIARMNLIGDGLHNFLDGMIIGVSFLASNTIGITTTVAILLHEIPQEIGDFGILIHSGLSKKRALMFNFFCALFAILGTVISLIIGLNWQGYIKLLLPITAGGFLYIAGSDLIPELQSEIKFSNSFLQLVFIILGISIMAILV